MIVSCPRHGRIWGSDAMVRTMEMLRGEGVNWIAIHPYASIREDGAVRASYVADPERDVSWLTRPIAEAHRLGLKIMIKPHLAYWGSRFSWRGEIEFQTDRQWDRFFTSYERWINRLATICEGADAFTVGTELERTVHHEARWRAIISSVRSRTEAQLTYAANWDRYERVRFWDALDVIGIQAYFPLIDHDRGPEPEELNVSWGRIVQKLAEYGRRHDRRILFSELGYHRSSDTARRPWASGRTGSGDAELVQRRCLHAALGAVDGAEHIIGAFLWKWFPGERAHGSHQMSAPAMRQVIADRWGTR